MLPVESAYPIPDLKRTTNIPLIAALPNEIIKQIFAYLPSPCKMALASRSFRNLANLWYQWELERIQKVPLISLYQTQPQILHLGSARQSPIEAKLSEQGAPSLEGKGDEEDILGDVAASPNSKFVAASGINAIDDSLTRLHQLAINRLHSVASCLFSNTQCNKRLTPLERYEWECEITNELISTILREYPLSYKTSCVIVLKQLAIPLQIDLPVAFHQINVLLINNEQIALMVNKIIHSTRFSSLKKLHVITKGIIFIPEWISQFTHLEKVDMSYNLIFKVPPELGMLRNLRKLNLQFNVRLNDLPDQISQLTNLTKLNLGDNEFTQIPEPILKLPNLQKLLLHRNHISHLSKSLGNLTSLNYLNLNRNKIVNLPEEVSHLRNLRELSINYNELSTLPDKIATLSQLMFLSLACNKLTTLSPSLELISELTVLEISGNKITCIPQELKSKPNLTIRNSF